MLSHGKGHSLKMSVVHDYTSACQVSDGSREHVRFKFKRLISSILSFTECAFKAEI